MRFDRKSVAGVVLALLVVGGCSDSKAKIATVQETGPPLGAIPVVGGCSLTQVYTGPVPKWLDEIEDHNPPNLPYAIARPPIAAGFFFGSPPLIDHNTMKATGRGNKVFWSLKGLKEGEAATMDVYPLGSSIVVQHYDLPGPGSFSKAGGTHGDGLDVPTPGCWRFVLRWDAHQAEIDLEAEAGLNPS
jgi:hypothetical protein